MKSPYRPTTSAAAARTSGRPTHPGAPTQACHQFPLQGTDLGLEPLKELKTSRSLELASIATTPTVERPASRTAYSLSLNIMKHNLHYRTFLAGRFRAFRGC